MNLMHVLGQRFVLDMRLEAYRHLQKLSLTSSSATAPATSCRACPTT